MNPALLNGVRDAVILAAGNGDRFKDPNQRSKLLHPVLGRPLILHALASAAAAGITSAHVILGYDADRVQGVVERAPLPGLTVDFTHNPDWLLENGVSALKAEERCADRPFALLMGDHLFDPALLRSLLAYSVGPHESVLAVDCRPATRATTDEATRVQLDGDYLVRIGKGLSPFDGLDTGVFVFAPSLFAALREAQAEGKTTLSDGVQRLAASRQMRAAAIVASSWYDIDTRDDLTTAESLIAGESWRS